MKNHVQFESSTWFLSFFSKAIKKMGLHVSFGCLMKELWSFEVLVHYLFQIGNEYWEFQFFCHFDVGVIKN
jgi:hypothetical protein